MIMKILLENLLAWQIGRCITAVGLGETRWPIDETGKQYQIQS
jgi:hypothetical protein